MLKIKIKDNEHNKYGISINNLDLMVIFILLLIYFQNIENTITIIMLIGILNNRDFTIIELFFSAPKNPVM